MLRFVITVMPGVAAKNGRGRRRKCTVVILMDLVRLVLRRRREGKPKTWIRRLNAVTISSVCKCSKGMHNAIKHNER